MARKGVSPTYAKLLVRTNTTIIAALMVYRNDADAMLVGPIGRFKRHLDNIVPVIGMKSGVSVTATLTVLISNKGTFFFCDPYVNFNPSAGELAEIVILAADQLRHFGCDPKIALLSHSNFGSNPTESALKMQHTLKLVNQLAPELEIEGEMHGDVAIDPDIRQRIFPDSKLTGIANLLVMPNMDAANISFNLAKAIGDGLSIGPVLLGLQQSAHILTPSTTVRGIFNMTALAVVEAQKCVITKDEFATRVRIK